MRRKSSPGSRLNFVGLLQIAFAAKKLDVLVRVAAAFGDRDNVIEFEVVSCSAFGALAAVTLPDPLAHFTRDMAVWGSGGTANQGLVVKLKQGLKPLKKQRVWLPAAETDGRFVLDR